MAFNISAQSASGGVGKTKQRLVLIGFVLAAVFVALFILQSADKKKGKPNIAALASSSASTASPATTTAVSQYQQNLGQSVSNYQRVAANSAQGGAPTAPATASRPSPYPQQGAAAYGQQAPVYGQSAQQGTIPPTAYTQPGYAPPQSISMPLNSAQVYPRNAASDSNQGRDELARARDKRAFEARYGSSIAKSIRVATPAQNPASGNSATPPASTSTATANAAAQLPGGLGAQLAEIVANRINATNPDAAKPAAQGHDTTKSTEKAKHPSREPGTLMIPEGTTIDTVLQTRLNGSFAGPAKVMVTQPVYDRARQVVLIPAGSILLGDVRMVQKIGEERLAVSFHRLLRPDGYTKDLDSFTGLDQIGETALKDKVNHHYMEVFGVSVALGAISGLSQMNTGYGISESSSDMYRQGFSQSLDQSAQRILDKYTNILPTLTIREGTRVKVYLTNDLYMPPSIDKPILD